MFRHTKIVVTVGPASSSYERLEELMEAGADVFRLNFSHGEHADKALVIEHIREISKQRKRAVAILGDLQGPKIRTGRMRGGEMQLFVGEEVCFTTRDVLGADNLIPTSYQALPRDVEVGNRVLLDDGLLELTVLAVEGEEVRCRVEVGGLLRDNKGINLPGVTVSAPALTEKDLNDLQF